jgi:hypothetical protein
VLGGGQLGVAREAVRIGIWLPLAYLQRTSMRSYRRRSSASIALLAVAGLYCSTLA